MGRGLFDAGHRAVPAVEHGLVLGHGDLMGRVVERPEVGVVGAPVGVAQLGPGKLEIGAHLNQRQHLPPQPGHAFAGSGAGRGGAAQVRGRVLPAVGSGEVDQPAAGQRRLEALAGLVVEHLPA